ncbi:MAG: SPASM domain-containing protein [Lachnospiraceae bacterium]|jgi:MoaA/NifB/PqqE/SkfB family radical SAM enzyme|nr:SPASM domain-containing protein [Lachnospiraceae bacterium]
MCALNDSLEPEEYYDCLLRFTSDYLKSGAKMPVEIWKFLNLDPEKIKEDLKNKRKTADGNTERRETDSRAADDGETGSKYFERNFVCADNRNMISVSADGELYPCITMTGLFHEKGISFGNVKKNGLQTYLQSGPYLTEVCRTLGDFKKRIRNADPAGISLPAAADAPQLHLHRPAASGTEVWSSASFIKIKSRKE